jgi:hypothetical protein
MADQATRTLIDDVVEMRSLWPGDAETGRRFMAIIGNALAGVPVIPYCLWKWRGQARFAPSLLLAASYLVAFSGAILHLRLALPLAVFGAVFGCGLYAILCDLAAGKGWLVEGATRVAAAVVVAFGAQVFGIEKGKVQDATKSDKPATACLAKPVAQWLNEAQPRGRSGNQAAPIIMTESVNFSPELAYWTNYRFVGGPYHRGGADMADMIAFANGTDDAAARTIINRREVDFVLICLSEVPRVIGRGSPQSLYHRLHRSELPAWLRPVRMSSAAEAEFRLFQVGD